MANLQSQLPQLLLPRRRRRRRRLRGRNSRKCLARLSLHLGLKKELFGSRIYE